MTEFSDARPADHSQFFDIMRGGSPELLYVVSEFDEARSFNLDKIAVAVTTMYDSGHPSTPGEDEVPNLTKEANAFANVTSRVLSDQQHLEEKVAFLIKIFQEASSERAQQFETLSPSSDECVERWDDEELEKLFTEFATNPDGLNAAVLQMQHFYLGDYTIDVQALAEQIVQFKVPSSESAETQVTQSTFEIKKTSKDHAVDIVKIAGGALAALLAYDRIRRGRGQ